MGSGADAGVSLAGTWRGAVADEELRRAYPDPDFDDEGWEHVPVPGQWRDVAAFCGTDGPLLYRHQFSVPAPARERRAWLIFDGLCYQSDVWLDGGYLGDTEGYFSAHRFEVTQALGEQSEHVLALELACSPSKGTSRRNITGSMQADDQPASNPGGIWRPVRVVETGSVAITALRALCVEAGPDSATVSLRATLDAAAPTAIQVHTAVGGAEVVEEHVLATGLNERTWQVHVDQPALWWPHALGDAVVTDLSVTVVAGAEDAVSDARAHGIGLRRLRMKHGVFTINGERLFLKGAQLDPPMAGLANFTAEEAERQVLVAKEAGLDVLRVRGHISAPELYDAADRHGLLLWQDFPLQGACGHGVRKQAVAQAAAAVDALGHHPSVAVWCAHDGPPEIGGGGALLRWAERHLPSWNRTVLDASVKRSFERTDPTRPAIAHAETLPDCDLPQLAARVPRAVEFPIGVGSRSRVRHHIESLRRLKYRPTGGFCETASAEGNEELIAACAPVIVVAAAPESSYAPGEPITLDVHVVSDLRVPLLGARVNAAVSWADGSRTWSWAGDLDPDCCSLVGTIRTNAPDRPGRFRVVLDLVHDGAKATNRYSSEVLGG